MLLAGPAAALAADAPRSLTPIGAVRSIERLPTGARLTTADGGSVTVTFLAPDLVRVRTLFPGQPTALDHSWAIAKTDWPRVDWNLTEAADAVTLDNAELRVVVHRDPLRVEFRDAATGVTFNADHRPVARDAKTGAVNAAKKLGFDEHFYGLGEKAARLDKRRGKFVMWNTDAFKYVEGTDPLYQSIPFYLGLNEGRGYGLFFDNSHRTTFEFGHLSQENTEYTAEGGLLDYYYFHGPDLKKIVSRYTELTGRMPLPPLWALGHQQSRYSYYPEAVVERLVHEYRSRDLPLDVVHIDIHYMDGYRVFTWDKNRFPDPAALHRRLAAQGVHTIAIVDPGVKQDDAYSVYQQGLANNYFLRRTDGSLFVGEVWPGKSVFVDYTQEAARRWWGDLHHTLLDVGVSGIWTDMNEPSDFLDQTGAKHADVVFDDLGQKSAYAKNRNIFALTMARATYEGVRRLRPEVRPFVISRAGYAGIQRYAAKWTGDNHATFEAVALNIPMFTTLGLSGETFVGADIPGYTDRADAELLVRAYQTSLFTPFLRNHTSIDQYDNEPWRHGAHAEAIIRKFLKLRYALLPFLYTTIEEAHRTGLPVFRPLVLNFPGDASTRNLDDQYMVGDTLLVAPALRRDQRQRDVYLPAGPWFDFWTGAQVAGGRVIETPVPLDHLPLYVRGGSIVPSTVPMNHTGEKPWSPLRFDVYPDDSGRAAGSVYEDDGATFAHEKGAFRRTALALEGTRLTLSVTGTHTAPTRDLEITVHAQRAVASVTVGGTLLPASAWSRSADGRLTLRFPDPSRDTVIEFR
jgi:alpha-glucosidase